AFGGKLEIMQHIAPLGNVYQAGTLSGNPLAMIAGYTLLKHLKNHPEVYTSLEEKGNNLHKGIKNILDTSGIPYVINQLGSMISIHFSKQPVTDFASAASADNAFFNRFFHAMLDRGIYLPPSAFETWFLSDALSTEDIEQTLVATKESLEQLLN
ncbi:MAG: aminotransferase class III-fold pyridoxal phosphate-dependent enzyme, partial [Flavisolibacter sp.]